MQDLGTSLFKLVVKFVGRGLNIYLYRVDVEDSGTCVLGIYIVRTIRGGYAYAVEKVQGVTWIKKSKKNGDYGWDDSINKMWRSKIKEGEKFHNLHTTKLAAYRYTLKNGP